MTNLETASTIAYRDASGRIRAASPNDNLDVVNKTTMDKGLSQKVDKTFNSSLFYGAAITDNTASGAKITFNTKDTST